MDDGDKVNKKELDFILQEGEGLKIEFKESLNNIDKELVAFSNAEGGRIFLGVSDDNKIKGVKINNKLKSQIQDIANNCDPSIKIGFEQFDDVLLIKVEEGEDKPYKCSSGFYLRQGPNSQKLTRDEILDFAIGEGKLRFDEQINTLFEFKRDLDEKKLDKYLKLAKITKNLKIEDMAVNLGIAVKAGNEVKFNNAGVLFFSRNPERFFLVSKVVCANYQTNEKVNILDKKVFDNGIIENIQEAINYAQKHINVEYEIKKLERKELPQYPEEAIRECIVNAVMHRDYFDKTGDVLIEVFKNKIAISNPGGLVKWLKREDFGTTSRTRNPLIANLLAKTMYVEKLGTGINRIRKAMSNAGLPPPEFRFNGSFFVTLYDKTNIKSGLVEGLAERLVEGLAESQKKILSEIKDNISISKKELAAKIGISTTAIDKNIATLKRKGLLKRIGPDKGGHWEIAK